ncbi:thioredoxin family protein [Pseudoteredinibacter isoporae]|uniref:Thioredoxin n=1 Tax=Pseudoteredinibacter isoporae TaxID=570281 RepID=A0A7X0JQ48_9GAMM|nr:thioredoxin domain-containing protein [Pseudoteredinibacter isoporae]MBB6520224.1 thioredoxin [Pseudoteredinibacter isoporae]NHO85796.1 thiol reductase thioredoxin [Pseudoteredinibacter isoporae]NIB25752.1 thiol reductase thioredoxin [Pseudoteredinibacter isoporae]
MTTLQLSDENFQQTLNNADKPLLVDVWAPWCGPCKMVGPAVERIHADKPEWFSLGMANMEEFSAMAEQYDIKATPTLLLFKDGKEIARRSGAAMQSQILSWLQNELGNEA